MTVAPFDHPFLSGLLGDEELAAAFSPEADLAAMLRFEAGLAEAEAAEGLIPTGSADAIAKAISSFQADIDDLRQGTTRDGVVVPALVRQLRRAVGPPHGEHVHFGATSQDLIDTSLAIRLATVLAALRERLRSVIALLEDIERRDGDIATMAHTRMQAAVEVPARRKILSWKEPLERELTRLDAVEKDVLLLQFGGAAGTLDTLGGKSPAVAGRLARTLGLEAPQRPRHNERDGIAAFAGWLSTVSGSLAKMGQDIALMAQSEIGEITLSSGGGSSAMPHKVNPVAAETLVALGRFNATLVSGMHHAMIHENERSGAAWTLEWMLLPQMIVAAGCALRTSGKLLSSISFRKA